MISRMTAWRGISALLLGALWLAQPGGAQAGSTSVAIVEPTDNPDDYAYDQPTVIVAAGASVTWVNNGLESHTVTADSGAFDSADIDPGKTWTYTFATPGTFTYYCDPHPWMQGTVIVNPAGLPG